MNGGMEIPIMSLDINNELDIMLAHRRGMQFAKFSGMSLSEQTRFATAVSEISRNSVEYAFNAAVHFSVVKKTDKCILFAIIKDEGKGIPNLEEILERNTLHYKGRGLGIIFAKKLADDFKIVSSPKGTTVYLQKNIPVSPSLINNLVVQGWIKHLQNEPAISAYEELKMRNIQLVELSEELKTKASIVEQQIGEIRNLNNKLSITNERLKAFTYAISHDLKTPLTNLKISSDYLINKGEDPDIPVFRNILSRSVSRLDRTIHSLIEVLDLQNGEKHVIRHLDFAASFSEAVEEFDIPIKEAGVKINADFSGAPTIRYIEGFLQSLLRNLLSNAIKYRDPARPLVLDISTTRDAGGAIELVFTDNASGMDLATIKDRLFAPFTRFSNSGEGKGIGLYMIKSMVEMNGGKVSVESSPGKGTNFYFSLVPYA